MLSVVILWHCCAAAGAGTSRPNGETQPPLQPADTRDGAPRPSVASVQTSPPYQCVITDARYGAKPDNTTINTAAIQRAIDACHAASPAWSRVVVPEGAFKTGSLELRSNMELHLEAGAGLYGSTNPSDYPIVEGLPFGKMWRALISGYNLTNVKVTGSNTAVPAEDDRGASIIDGVGWWWNCLLYESHGSLTSNIPNPDAAPYCKIFNPHNRTVAQVAGMTGRAPLRPKLVEMFNCTSVTIADFTAQNAACWTIHPTYSRDVVVQRMTVRGPREIGGVDGIDPDSCVNCVIEDCHVDSGDDGISIKSYNYSYVPGPTPCKNVTIRRTTVLSRNVCLGASTSGGVFDVTFEDIILGDQATASLPWAIKFKISAGVIENVTFRRIQIGPVGDTPWMYPDDRAGAFMIDFFDHNRSDPVTWVRNIAFEDINVVSAKILGHISGPGSCIDGLIVRNLTVGKGRLNHVNATTNILPRQLGWGGCTGVDRTDAVIDGVVPPLVCGGCEVARCMTTHWEPSKLDARSTT